MTWVKLDDGFTDHPKVDALSDAAFRMYVRSICYSARLLTDGLVPVATAKRWGSQRRLNELVDGGVFDVCDGGYSIHDYLEYNPSRVQVLMERASAAERQQRFRNSRSNAVTNASPSHPIPSDSDQGSTDPPQPPKQKRATEVDEDFRARMVEKYAGLATAEEVNERINDALSHTARRKWTDIQRYVQNWLRDDREFVRRTAGGGAQSAAREPHGRSFGARGVARNGTGPGTADEFGDAPPNSIRATDKPRGVEDVPGISSLDSYRGGPRASGGAR